MFHTGPRSDSPRRREIAVRDHVFIAVSEQVRTLEELVRLPYSRLGNKPGADELRTQLDYLVGEGSIQEIGGGKYQCVLSGES